MVKTGHYRRGYTFHDGEEIYFDMGNFDEWCVYLEKNNRRRTPKDIEYFTELYSLGDKYGFQEVYNSFLQVCDSVQKNEWGIDDRKKCERVCKEVDLKYDEDTLKLWITFFMTMLAEENKANSILGKTIKNLAVYKILIRQENIEKVTKEMVGKRHYELQNEMDTYGIVRRDR